MVTTSERTIAPVENAAASNGGDSGQAALRVVDVSVVFGARVALDGVTFAAERGQVIGLLGPNGAGKTTMVDVCCGMRTPTRGSVAVLGRSPTTDAAAFRRAIGMLPQESALYPELTGMENLELFAALYGIANSRQRCTELLMLLDLWTRRKSRVATYSGGMQRRLALARALLHDPVVLFLDEPTLGVDIHGRRGLWEHVRRLRDDGRCVLVTTNYLDEAAAVCDRVVILDGGRVVADVDPAALHAQDAVALVLTVTGEPAGVVDALRRRHPGLDVSATGREVRVAVRDASEAADVVVTARQHAQLTALRTVQPTLDDVFLRLTATRRQ
ncbi:MAG: ATP-binding cassette domain-containing protein [Mycobacteriales bacterium]|nr:ABC transporter ATP-binding protein [Frankia sp.]